MFIELCFMAWRMVHPRECSMCSQKNVCSAVVEWYVLQMSVRPRWLVVLFKSSVFLMISCLVVLSICGVFYNTTKQFSNSQWTLTECPTNLTQFWHYQPGDSVRFHKLRVQSSQDCSHFRHQSQVQVVTCASDWLVISQRVPQTSPWVWLICKAGSRNSEKHLLTLTNLL